MSIPQSYRSRPGRGELDTIEIPVQRQVPPARRQQPAAGTPARAHRRRAWAAGGLAFGLVVVGAAGVLVATDARLATSASEKVGRFAVAAAPSRAASSGPSPSTVALVSAPTGAAAASGPGTGIGDGTWKVGDNVAPGTYTTAGADGSSCYYARLRNNDGSVDDIIDIMVANGPATVVIRPTDGWFRTAHCSTWKRVG